RSSEMGELDLPEDRQALTMGVERSDETPSLPDGQISPGYLGQNSSLTDASFESDLLSISDSDSISLLDQKNPMLPLLRVAVVCCLISGYQAYIKKITSGSRETESTSWGAASGPSSSGPSTSGEKKRRQTTRGDGDEWPPGKPPHKRKKRSGSVNASKRIFACPFAKAHPSKYDCCFSKVLSRIRDVKHNLNRGHCPEFYCGRCSRIFPDERSHQEHVADPAGLFCPPSAQLDGLTHEQRRQLSRKSNPKSTVEEQWFVLWEIVFPNRPRPVSPYQDANVSEELWSFRAHWDTYSETILDRAAQAMVDAGRYPGFQRLSEEERQGIVRWLAREGFERAWGDFISTRPPVSVQSDVTGAMSTQDATPAGGSQADSGVAVETLPPASVSRLNDPVEGVTGESSEEGSPSGLQRGLVAEEESAEGPSTMDILPGLRLGDDEALSYNGYAPETWDWGSSGLDQEEIDRIWADVDRF
ncbi:hypothetical protein NEMBOFW57_007879, partial [Staphylotrichum longicolle]